MQREGVRRASDCQRATAIEAKQPLGLDLHLSVRGLPREQEDISGDVVQMLERIHTVPVQPDAGYWTIFPTYRSHDGISQYRQHHSLFIDYWCMSS